MMPEQNFYYYQPFYPNFNNQFDYQTQFMYQSDQNYAGGQTQG